MLTAHGASPKLITVIILMVVIVVNTSMPSHLCPCLCPRGLTVVVGFDGQVQRDSDSMLLLVAYAFLDLQNTPWLFALSMMEGSNLLERNDGLAQSTKLNGLSENIIQFRFPRVTTISLRILFDSKPLPLRQNKFVPSEYIPTGDRVSNTACIRGLCISGGQR